ncbi:hypothetical protein [Streptomyces sp. NPDC055013]
MTAPKGMASAAPDEAVVLLFVNQVTESPISLLPAHWASYDAQRAAGSAPQSFEGAGCAPPAVVQARV